MASGLLVLLSGCAQPEPSSLQPSISPSPSESEMATESLPMTIWPATPAPPAPSVNGAAHVLVAVDDTNLSYAVEGCPVTAWLDAAIEDDINFGIYPEYLTADNGTRWSTHLVVLQIIDASVTDWSFVLTSPVSGIPGDAERSLISWPDRDIQIRVAITPSQATFTTAFWDTQRSDELAPQPVRGTVSVTCR
jgi:hypothetical protein